MSNSTLKYIGKRLVISLITLFVILMETWNKKPFQGNKKTLKPLKLQGFSLVRGTGLEFGK